MPDHHNILVTGTSSGLGKCAARYFNATPFHRSEAFAHYQQMAAEKPFDLIVHAAFNKSQSVTNHELGQYLDDTLFLTENLLRLPHHTFVFISTIDVYPKNNTVHGEEELIDIEHVPSLYGKTKLMCESLVRKHAKNALILRPSALLGKDAKPNSLTKIMNKTVTQLTLSAQSTFNYILHDDVCRFIERSLKQPISGVFNLVARDNVSLNQVAESFASDITFGDYLYETGVVSNEKITAIFEAFKASSLENIMRFNKHAKQVEHA